MRKKFILLLIILMVCSTFFVTNGYKSQVFAEENTQTQENPQFVDIKLGEEVTRSVITDGNLYDGLISEFNRTFQNHEGFVPVDKVYVDMFSTVLELNLENKIIYNLNGFSILNLPNLTHLNLSKNRISEIKLNLINCKNLTHLNLFDNRISELTLNYLPNLTEVNLNHNQLTKVNLNQIKTGKILLNNNLISSQNDVKLNNNPSNLVVELINNKLTNINKISGVTFEIGLVGLINFLEGQKIESNKQLKFYPFHNYDINLVIYNATNNEIVKTFTTLEETLTLPFGEYYGKYENGNSKEIYNPADPIFCAFKPISSFEVVPSLPKVFYKINGKTYESYTGLLPKNTKLVFSAYDENAIIYYKIAQENDWKQGNEVLIEEGGVFNIQIKSVVNNVESQVVNLSVQINSSNISNFVVWLIISLFSFFAIIGYIMLKNKGFFSHR